MCSFARACQHTVSLSPCCFRPAGVATYSQVAITLAKAYRVFCGTSTSFCVPDARGDTIGNCRAGVSLTAWIWNTCGNCSLAVQFLLANVLGHKLGVDVTTQQLCVVLALCDTISHMISAVSLT